MATKQQLLDQLAALHPEYWAWLQSKPTALAKVMNLASQGLTFNKFVGQVEALKSYGTWVTGGTVDEEVIEPEEEFVEPPDTVTAPPPFPGAQNNGDGTWTLANGGIVDSNGRLVGTPGVLSTLSLFLADNELPGSLIEFIKDALAGNKPYDQIIAELRETPEYKAAYPENDLRRQNGFSWMPEAEIRAYRDEARRLSQEYYGWDLGNSEISELIGRGTSLRLWEHRLQVNKQVERWGAAVQQVFEQSTGAPLSEARLHAFFDPDFATPDIDRLYERALMRGQPAELGFGIRPEEEADILEQFGIPVEQIFQNYKTIAGEMPRFERLAAIGNYLQGPGAGLFGDISVSGSLLFRAIQLGDPTAILELQRRAGEESAKWQAEGGPSRTQGGVASGLGF
jgi:hypothetical protein